MATDERSVLFCASDLGDPLLFDDVPDWLDAAIKDGRIVSFEAGEDYWYLRVQTADGPKTASPGDWIVMDATGQLNVRTLRGEVFNERA